MNHIIALSGGKDSTALALRMAEVWPEIEVEYFCTPTGDELPEMHDHWANLEVKLGQKITMVTNGTLDSWVEHYGALPNWRMRWCTRHLKIEPCIKYLKGKRPATLYVGLRADEEHREGLYGPHAEYRYPLREWGWNYSDVVSYLKDQDVEIPKRTDCARCYAQRLVEWKTLWRDNPEIYQDAAEQERATRHTFRSPGRDSWPASLDEMREKFRAGHTVAGDRERLQGALFDTGADSKFGACRICRM
jgi:3'-phosphoadenosine 5'-phosphosulfate sulfotransferase (PAPS reductase)/FAD synthetase